MTDIVLNTTNLTKRYGDLIAVDRLTLEVHQGEIFGFLGPNGAGKTTSIQMICGLLKPDSGQVYIQGNPMVDEAREMRYRIGVCPQEVTVWEKLTCLEQLEFIGEMYGVARRTARGRGGELLEVLGLMEKRNRIAEHLSGGMRRRLNLALALVHDPPILILDEPETGLDPQSRVLVREYIRSLAGKKTIILTTHNMDEADRLADRVAIIDHGRLLVVDRPERLKRSLGDGGILEIRVLEGEIDNALKSVIPLVPEASPADHSLLLRGSDLMALLPEILQTLRLAQVTIQDVHMRTCTLEDVFISLTGRKLRE